jgi:hypothetical protein
MGVYMIVSSLAILVTSTMLGAIARPPPDVNGIADKPENISMVLTYTMVPCWLIASFCYYMSNFDYADRMNKLRVNRAQELAEVITIVP